MIEKIWKYMQKEDMLRNCDTIVLGVSGGADSVCLLLAFEKIKKNYQPTLSLEVVHVHHMIRGVEADRDEEFVQTLCKRLQIPCKSYRENVPQLAKEWGMSCEEAGREIRYRIFAGEAQRLETQGKQVRIAVAHHKDDQAETVLMHLLRGSGFAGLAGMMPVRERIMRPLLCVTKKEILSYLHEQKQEFMTDSTNNENDYTRNRLRNVCIPYMEEHFHANVIQHLCAFATFAGEAQEYFVQQAQAVCMQYVTVYEEENRTVYTLALQAFEGIPHILKTYVVREVLAQVLHTSQNVYKVHIEQVLALEHMQTGKEVHLPNGLVVKRQYEAMAFMRSLKEREETRCEKSGLQPEKGVGQRTKKEKQATNTTACAGLPERAAAAWSERRIELDAQRLEEVCRGQDYVLYPDCFLYTDKGMSCKVKKILITRSKKFEISGNNSYTKYFDYDTIKGSIHLCFRYGKAEDIMVIGQAGQKKLLKKELKDRKVLAEARSGIFVLADEKQIFWAVGIRQSFDSMVTAQKDTIIKISIELQEE